MGTQLNAKALVVGLARDSGAGLAPALANVERLAGLFAETSVLFLENDSQDSTKVSTAWLGVSGWIMPSLCGPCRNPASPMCAT